MSETISEISDLPGVGSETEKRLVNAGYATIMEIAATPLRELVDKAKLGDETARKIIQAARSRVKPEVLELALDLYNRRKTAVKLLTGSKALDDLLGGGIQTQAVTEFVGEFATGKSQICMKLCVMAQLSKDQGGFGGKALFIDTEGTFSPERIVGIASSMGLDAETVLGNILYARAESSDHQAWLVDHAGQRLYNEKIKLVIMDSIISHFRSEYIGRENLSERQQKLNAHIHKLLRLAESHNLAVVITNQTQANPGAFFGDPNRPAGGNVLAHATTHRVYIRKSKGSLRVARVMDSPSLPEGMAMFKITEKGIEDGEKPKESSDTDDE